MSIYRATLRGAVLSGVALGALSVANSAAWAQQTPPAPATVPQTGEAAPGEGDVIIVTGTRLRQETFDSPNPVSVIGQEEVENRQIVNTIDLIEDLPLVGIGVNNRGTQTQNGDSFAFPDVLDLGTQRTLTLVNGRRVVSSNPNTLFVPGNASGSQVDLSVFSPNVIERVDVLAGTGGAIYGADAVGGVVNVITKSNYEGLNLTLQGGLTEINEGESIKFAGTWGMDFMEGRGNITIAADYFSQSEVVSSDDDSILYGGSGITNVLEGSVRRSGTFDPLAAATAFAAAGGTLPSAFLATGSDFQRTTHFGPFSLQNPLVSYGGTLLTGPGPLATGFVSTTPLVPATPVAGGLARPGVDPQGFAFFAPSSLPTGVTPGAVVASLAPTVFSSPAWTAMTPAKQEAFALNLLQRSRPTPYEYYRNNPGLNGNLFAGTFGTGDPRATNTGALPNTLNGFLTTTANTDPATMGLFPRVAAPYQFGTNGNLSSFNIGNLAPPYQARIGTVFGGQGYDPFADGLSQVQAGTDRIALAAIGKYDITDWLRYDSLVMFTSAEFQQLATPSTNSSLGSTTAGTLAVPIYINQNPYLNTQALSTIQGLVAAGQPTATLAGQQVLYMGRSMADLLGGANTSTLGVDNFQITQSLEGDFEFGFSDFYWDVAAGYGRSDQNTSRADILDVEFWMATDVVAGPGGAPVCRQQTLAAPESLTVRYPNLSPINNLNGLIPTAAQVAACKPLNLFGYGSPSQAARDYVVGNANLHAMNSLEWYSASFGSDVIDLPAGPLQLGVNVETRKESSEFEPSRDTQRGLARTTTQGRSEAERTIDEYGFEANLPVFGGDFQYPLLNELSFAYAFRLVKREQYSPYATNQGAPAEDDTFSYSVRYKPIDDLTLRAAKSRTVRAAALVELFNPPSTGFTTLTLNTHPCTTTNIDAGTNPTARRANCVAAVQTLGIAPTAAAATTFLAGFQDTAGSRSAIAASNPDVRNEEGNTYTLGFTYEPSFVPNLTLAADFFSVDLTNEIALGGPLANECFDSSDFPNSLLGSTPACETLLFGMPTGPGGQFVIPNTNSLTGTSGLAGTAANTPAPVQAPFEIAFVQFLNLNAGGRQFRGVNFEARYNFELGDLPYIGGSIANWGDIDLRGTYFHTQRYDTYADNDLSARLDRLAGEHTNPEHKVRFDFGHRLGAFRHTLQWFWDSATVTDITTSKATYPELTPTFFADAFSYYNYNAEYAINDQLTARLTINNLFDTEDPRGGYGLANRFDGGIGREWIFGINYNF
jgi:outer membrane receptor protein involved in Fe transport